MAHLSDRRHPIEEIDADKLSETIARLKTGTLSKATIDNTDFGSGSRLIHHAVALARSPIPAIASYELLDLLLDAGADVNARMNSGWTALHEALGRTPDRRIVPRLLAAGAEVNVKDDCGTTPLHLAAGHQPPHVLRWLIDAGANVNARDNRGSTPLHEVSIAKIPAVGAVANIRLLLSAGADVEAVNQGGDTPLAVATACGRAESVELLQRWGRRRVVDTFLSGTEALEEKKEEKHGPSL